MQIMRRFTPLFVLVILTACTSSGTSGIVVSDRSLPAGTFHLDTSGGGAQGTAYVRGYARVLPVKEPFCDSNCQKFDYIYFRVLASGSGTLQQFITLNQGNASVGTQSVGLGCITRSGSIMYVNDADATGRKTRVLTQDIADAILHSTGSEPVTLALTKEPLTRGTEAPACYSHFTTVELVK